MSDKLQQAIQATRAGDKKNAQFLLTQAIQEDPDNSQTWYLLSLLVDDKEKKQAYLTNVIELDPSHTKAHEQLVAITEPPVPEPASIEEHSVLEETAPEVAPIALSSDSSDLESQDVSETLPDWMADDLPPVDETATSLEVETELVAEEPIPDWLDDSLDDDWDKEEDETAVVEAPSTEPEAIEDKQPEEKKEAIPKEEKAVKEKKEMSEQQLNYLLIGLVVVAVIIFFIMAYMVFTK